MDGEERKLKSSEKEVVGVPDLVDIRQETFFVYIADPQRSAFKTQEEFEHYERFAEEYNESHGFDIKHFPIIHAGDWYALCPLVPLEDSNPVFVHCKAAVQTVIRYLDENDEQKLELVKIIRANYRSVYMFFVTFVARDKVSRETQVYESKVFRHFLEKTTTLYILVKQGDPPPVPPAEPFFDGRHDFKFPRMKIPVSSDFENKADYRAYTKYIRGYNDSEGLDVEPVNAPDIYRVMLKPVLPDNLDLFEHCFQGVQMVVNYLNRNKEADLEFVRVIKANYKQTFMFYVTFEAKDNWSGGDKKLYQTIFFRYSFLDDEPHLLLFRKKKEAVEDKRKQYKFLEIRKCGVQKFKHLDDYRNYEKYAKELNDSQGFDCKTVVSLDVGDRARMLMPLKLSNPHDTLILKNCKAAVEIVLDHLENFKEKNLELVRVIKANYRASYMFFVTFKAKNKVSGTVNTYQSVIFREVYDDGDIVHNLTELHMFRRVRSKKGPEKCTSG